MRSTMTPATTRPSAEDVAAAYHVREWRDAFLVLFDLAISQHAWCSCFLCPDCTANYLAVDAASIRLDLAVAQAHPTPEGRAS